MEDELKLVKGEIKRTLVDLRSAVMQAESPFQRVVASPQASAAPSPPVTSAEPVRQEPPQPRESAPRQPDLPPPPA